MLAVWGVSIYRDLRKSVDPDRDSFERGYFSGRAYHLLGFPMWVAILFASAFLLKMLGFRFDVLSPGLRLLSAILLLGLSVFVSDVYSQKIILAIRRRMLGYTDEDEQEE
ncbi:hypothetical protein COB18_03365 [Candidatus Kaiserbacteria bacterium]|nr:MAG: hypothetical protein COB18_03365 [Candidatus Kaiserbacteria bacterium]